MASRFRIFESRCLVFGFEKNLGLGYLNEGLGVSASLGFYYSIPLYMHAYTC